MELRPNRTSIPSVDKVQNIPRIQEAALYCIIAKSNIYLLVGALAKN